MKGGFDSVCIMCLFDDTRFTPPKKPKKNGLIHKRNESRCFPKAGDKFRFRSATTNVSREPLPLFFSYRSVTVRALKSNPAFHLCPQHIALFSS